MRCDLTEFPLALAAALALGCTDGSRDPASGPDTCAAFELVGSIATIGGGEGWDLRRPDLTFSSDDGARVTLAAAWSPAGAPDGETSQLRYVSFFPWSDWPEHGSLEPSFVAHPQGGAAFMVAPSRGDRVAATFIEPSLPGTVTFSSDLVPGIGFATPGETLAISLSRLLFTIDGPSTHLIAFDRGNPHKSYYNVEIHMRGGSIDESLLGGCASEPVSADAVRFEDGWLVAMSNSVRWPSFHCTTESEFGPATRIDTLYLSEDASESFMGVEFETGFPIGHLALAPRSDGAWLVWTKTAQIQSSLRIAHMSRTGGLLFFVGATELTTRPPSAFAVADLGDRLVIARVEDPAAGVALTVIGGSDTAASHRTLSAVGPVVGAPALLTSRAGDRILVAWTEAWPEGDRVRVAQLECRAEGRP